MDKRILLLLTLLYEAEVEEALLDIDNANDEEFVID
jgi:hypothetical protein